LHFARFRWDFFESRGNSGKKMSPRAGATEANIVVRITWAIVQIQRLNPSIAAIVPIAATDETPPAIYLLHPYGIKYHNQVI
jgi:hypothetical protein